MDTPTKPGAAVIGRGARWNRLVLAAACLVFLVHALNYAYFFVDDEGIPLVYAQNLLRGHGLVYSYPDGRVEGYSNFLHIFTMGACLRAVTALGWPKYTVFLVGRGLSLLWGLCTLWVVGRMLLRLPGVGTTGRLAALLLLALAPPLATWSCSSLETLAFTLVLAVLAWSLIRRTTGADGVALVAAVLAILLRIDGFIYVGALLAAFLLTGSGERRRALLARVIAPVLVALVLYHAWRIWYFGEVLTMPLYAKVMYRLGYVHHAFVKEPVRPYLARFADVFGVPFACGVAAVIVIGAAADAPALALGVAATLMIGYVCLVGDWMYGFRFFVPVLPFLAILWGRGLSRVGIWAGRPVSVALAAGATLWLGVVAVQAARQFDDLQYVESWYRYPSLEPERFFGPYWEVHRRADAFIDPREVMAYNQAGFVPFMLDANNIDNLGICSKFIAKAPTTDVFYTQVDGTARSRTSLCTGFPTPTSSTASRT